MADEDRSRWPRSALSLNPRLPQTRTYWSADDALYSHEREFYSYAATGHPIHIGFPEFSARWSVERERLERCRKAAWAAACRATVRHPIKGTDQ